MDQFHRRYLPKMWGDRAALIFTVICIHIIGLFELLVVLPYIDPDRANTFWLHTAVGVFIYVNVMGSLAKTIGTDTTSGSTVLPSILKPGWRFCSACEANAPPRSFHCWACKSCILKRDHHCIFTGNCIGFANHRYYVTMVLYLWFAASYCTFLNMDYTWEVLGGFNWKSLLTMVMPMVSWLLGLSLTFTFTVSFISSTCIISFFLLGTLFVYSLINILNGQTVHERAMGIKEFDIGWKGNIEVVFGKNWNICWLSPWISSPLYGDGITFRKKNMPVENVKDM